jgi:hypothetical protein
VSCSERRSSRAERPADEGPYAAPGPTGAPVASRGNACNGACGAVGWFVLACLLLISSVLNWVQVIVVGNAQIRVFRGALSLVMLFLTLLAIRKGLAEKADR